MFWFGAEMPQTVTIPGQGEFPVAGALHQFLDQRTIPLLQFSMVTFQNSTPAERGKALIYKPFKAWNGYTLLSAIGGPEGQQTVLIDMFGNVKKTWPLFPFPAKMLPNGDIIGGAAAGLPDHQEQGALAQMDWCGNVVWSWAGPPNTPGGARAHHDYQREGNPVGYYAPGQNAKVNGGTTLVLAHANPDPALTAHIFTPVEDPNTHELAGLEDDVIYEVGPNGNVLWQWDAWKAFEQMGFSPVAKQALKTFAVGAPRGIGGGFYGSDWQHINNINYLGPNKWYDRGDERFHPDNIIWDGRSSNIIAIIARHDHPRGNWKSGDIVWRVGPDYSFPNAEHQLGQIIGQHHAHMIPKGLPGEGNILVFDNGGLAGFGSLIPGGPPYWPVTYRNFSRVIEFNPRTMEVEWEYVNPNVPAPGSEGPRKFFSWFISSAQRLPNGNTMIDEGSVGRIFEVTRSGEIVWEYISPFQAPPEPGQDSTFAFGNAVYRAYRVPFWWVPIGKKCPPRSSNAAD